MLKVIPEEFQTKKENNTMEIIAVKSISLLVNPKKLLLICVISLLFGLSFGRFVWIKSALVTREHAAR
jgi:ABC-type transporter Mla maintaining outer membrane lipid asymmetry permease subunit MlaE